MVSKDSGKVLMKYPWILSPSVQENYPRIVSLLESESVRLILEMTSPTKDIDSIEFYCLRCSKRILTTQ